MRIGEHNIGCGLYWKLFGSHLLAPPVPGPRLRASDNGLFYPSNGFQRLKCARTTDLHGCVQMYLCLHHFMPRRP